MDSNLIDWVLGMHDQDEEETPTWPTPGGRTLTITLETDALFVSATHHIRARIDGKVYAESKTYDEPPHPDLVAHWARTFIKTHYNELRQRAIDADAAYVDWGGRKSDLI